MKVEIINLYCDESCHIEHDHKPYFLISYISCPLSQVNYHTNMIKQLKNKHHFNAEIKWSKVSHSKYYFYTDLIDYFFSSDLCFRSIVVDKTHIKTSPGTYDDFYYKMYYQLIFHKISMDKYYNIYLDIKDTLSSGKVRKLKDILNYKFGVIRNLQNIRSHESLLMQLADFIMGALSYHLSGGNKVIAKRNIIDKIQTLSRTDLLKSTYKTDEKFNLFFIDLKRNGY